MTIYLFTPGNVNHYTVKALHLCKYTHVWCALTYSNLETLNSLISPKTHSKQIVACGGFVCVEQTTVGSIHIL